MRFIFILIILLYAFSLKAQQTICIFKSPQLTINFGSGNVSDFNSDELSGYRRVSRYCPSDGYYSFASYTSECFGDDWHTIPEDHTAGDADGNMLLVNAGWAGEVFLRTPINGLKSNTIYELGLWLMNLCRPSEKCPFPLLPNLDIRLETPEGKAVAIITTGEVPRVDAPKWTQHRAHFTTPASTSTLMLVMADNIPSGCGNDFALDDITFRECIKQDKPVEVPKKTPPKKSTAIIKPSTTPKTTVPLQKKVQATPVTKTNADTISKTNSIVKSGQKIFPSAPQILRTRENTLVRRIETETSEIKIDLYDNGEIDGDTISIYHNNTLIKSHMRLTQKPITITVDVNPSQPHHEIIMVAENLGSIPPNTSVMIITTASNRYQVFISSSEQKNAKIVFDLKN